MSRDKGSNGDAYDPERFVRGAVSEATKGRDKAGKKSPHQVLGLRLITAGGFVGLPYGFLRSLPWMNPEKKRIEMIVEGYHRHDGEWKLGLWLVAVSGSLLEPVFDHICLGKREWLHAGCSEGEEPFVSEVTVEWFADL